MLRLLIWITLIVASVWVWQRIKSGPQEQSRQPGPAGAKPMIQCAHCMTFIPKENAVFEDGVWYCCQNHLDEHRKNREN